MLIKRQRQLGFTLIELIAGIMIMGILAAVGIPNFMLWIQNYQLRTAAESITDGLQLARAEAVRRNTNVNFNLTGTSGVNSTWTVGCVIPVADLDGDGLPDCPTIIQGHSGVEGSRNAVVSAVAATITFNGFGRTGADSTIDITNPGAGNCMSANGPIRCLRVLVKMGGSVRMCNPALPASNLQGC